MATTAVRLLMDVGERMADDLDDLVRAMNAAETEIAPMLNADRTIEREMAASNRANAATLLRALRDPLGADRAETPPEAFDVIRTVVRRGLEIDVIFQAYRRGQMVVWERFVELARAHSGAGDQLVEGMALFATLLFGYVDRVLLALVEEAQRLRDEVLGGAAAKRAETVRLILDGAPIEERTGSGRLGYDLAARHTAMVLWCDDEAAAAGGLEEAATALARAAGGGLPLTVGAGRRTLWAWCATGSRAPGAGVTAVSAPRGVRAAIGRGASGVAGFRSSHADALAVADLLGGGPGGPSIVQYDEVEAILPMGADEKRAARFVRDVLGGLADDTARAHRLRETLRTFMACADSASPAAEILHTHRNTVLQRVAVATGLLGRDPGEHRLATMTALELAHYAGGAVLGD
ncbi:PucR family transcriptional regulator [Tsukamurella tyrosinosolvens]|uniref:PucR family transcriptional regulator n=1 Tax=Tsukamurella tyrosinosolvens TaxID=57704 RepID=UPI001FD296B9|nr:helix-turn-helix domain-containing protein [Tsukamurella tyrosinosolvens]